MSSPNPELRRDVEAALAARKELGPDFDDHVAAGLAERVEQLVEQRTVAVREQQQLAQIQGTEDRLARNQRLALSIVSLGAGIPITAIAGSLVDPPLIGVLVSWAGIAVINVAHALSGRRR